MTIYFPTGSSNVKASSNPVVLSADWSLYYSGKWAAYNSVWNKAALVNGVDFTQSITADGFEFPNATTIEWSWPSTAGGSNVYSFPSITFGVIDSGGSNINLQSYLTATKANTFNTLTLSHDLSISSSNLDEFDVIYDGYLTSTPNTTKLFEITIFVHTPSYMSSYVNGLATKYSYSGDGITWTVGITTASTPQIIFMPADASDILVKTIDLKAMFAFLIAQAVLTGDEYFSGIGLGPEPQKNSGTMTINSLTINWQ